MTKAEREQVRAKYGGRCAYCGCVLQKRWHADHRESLYRTGVPRYRDTSTVADLEPACQRCNLWKSVYTVEQFRYEIKKQVERLRSNSAPFRLAEDYGLVTVNTTVPVVFYFERET